MDSPMAASAVFRFKTLIPTPRTLTRSIFVSLTVLQTKHCSPSLVNILYAGSLRPLHPVSNPTTSESWNIIKWCRGNPFAAALVLAIAGTFFFFFGSVHLFVNASESAADWAMKAWNPEQDQEHSWIVPFVFIGLIYYHWEAILKAPKRGSPIGLAFAGFGVLLFLLSTRDRKST